MDFYNCSKSFICNYKLLCLQQEKEVEEKKL